MKYSAIALALTALSYAEQTASSNEAIARTKVAPPNNVASPQVIASSAAHAQGASYPSQAGGQGASFAPLTGGEGAFTSSPGQGSVALNNGITPAGLRTNSGQFVSMPGIAFPQPPLHQQFRPSREPPALKGAQLQANNEGLIPGDVFGLITLSDNRDINGETVVIYQDGTLGVDEPNSPGYLFEATLLPEYDLLIVPEPLATVKLNDKNVLFVNDSLYNPAPIFSSQQWSLRMSNGRGVVCPSWNSVLVYVNDNETPPCSDAVEVNLHIVPITV